MVGQRGSVLAECARQEEERRTSVRSRGFLVVLSGPSGAGKNTLLNAVLPRIPDLRYSVSVTTRPPRPGERHGVNYEFVTDAEFDQYVQADQMLEWAEFCGFRYGTRRRFVEESLARGETVITDIDIQGARQIKRNMPDGVFVFLLPPSLDVLRSRLRGRGTEGEEAITRRLAAASDELRAVADYDYWIRNDEIEDAVATLEAIIRAERCRVPRIEPDALTDELLEGGSL